MSLPVSVNELSLTTGTEQSCISYEVTTYILTQLVLSVPRVLSLQFVSSVCVLQMNYNFYFILTFTLSLLHWFIIHAFNLTVYSKTSD